MGMGIFEGLTKFGVEALDHVGEGVGNLIQNATKEKAKEATTNPGVTQQPATPAKDNHGNAVTGSDKIKPADRTLLYIGGGMGVCVVFIGLIIALKK